MSSRGAAARGNKEALLWILNLIETGNFSAVPNKKLQYLKRYSYITSPSHSSTLTEKGKRSLNECRIWGLTIPTPKRWDGKWRIVLFDIPIDKRKRRDSFRLRLKELGLTRYQNSVWIYPHPLENTINAVADFYRLRSCVSFITAESISGETVFRNRYKL